MPDSASSTSSTTCTRARTIGGLYNVQQAVASQVNNVTMLATDAGGDYSQVYNGVLLGEMQSDRVRCGWMRRRRKDRCRILARVRGRQAHLEGDRRDYQQEDDPVAAVASAHPDRLRCPPMRSCN